MLIQLTLLSGGALLWCRFRRRRERLGLPVSAPGVAGASVADSSAAFPVQKPYAGPDQGRQGDGNGDLRQDPGPATRLQLERRRRAANLNLLISAATAGVALLSSRFPILRPVAVVAVLYVSRDLFDRGCGSLRRGRYLGVSLVWTAILLATMASGHLLAATVLGLIGGSLSRTFQRIEHDVEQILRYLLPPEQTGVWVLADGVEVEVDPHEVAPGDRVVVNAGHVIPLDGRVQEGRGQVDHPLHGGRSRLEEKGPGDGVQAFTRLLTGRLIILV